MPIRNLILSKHIIKFKECKFPFMTILLEGKITGDVYKDGY